MRKHKGWWVDITESDGQKRTIGVFATYQEALDWSKYRKDCTIDAIVYRITYGR